MRSEPTLAEAKLWRILRGRRFSGYKFRRQVPIGGYIVDFVCFETKLVVEADGSQHGESTIDLKRGVRAPTAPPHPPFGPFSREGRRGG